MQRAMVNPSEVQCGDLIDLGKNRTGQVRYVKNLGNGCYRIGWTKDEDYGTQFAREGQHKITVLR